MSEPTPPQEPDASPPDPERWVPRVVPVMQQASPGLRLAGFLAGAFVGFVTGLGFRLVAIDGLGGRTPAWIGAAVVGPVFLALAFFGGRRLWTVRNGKVAAVGLTVLLALWGPAASSWLAGAIDRSPGSLAVAFAGPLQLVLAVLVGRWLWRSRNMKGAAVGWIVLASLWCMLALACGV